MHQVRQIKLLLFIRHQEIEMEYEQKYFVAENSGMVGPPSEMQEIKQQIQAVGERQDLMASKLNEIANRQEELAQMLAMTNALLARSLGIADDKCSKRFPLLTVDDLRNLDEELTGANRLPLVKTMRSLISNNLAANLSKLFSKQVILNVNYDGTKGKVALKKFDMLLKALFEASSVSNSNFDKFLLDLRHALKVNKNKLHQQASRLNKSARDPLQSFGDRK